MACDAPAIRGTLQGFLHLTAGSFRMQEKAYWMARKWIVSNYEIYNETRLMWEKYDVANGIARIGGGGEYVVQVSAQDPAQCAINSA